MSKHPPAKTPWVRRIGVGWLAVTFLLANTVSAAFLIALADRHRLRLDVTATGEHRLAEQTRRLIASVDPAEGFELVIAADAARVDPRAWQALLDVSDELQAAGPVRVTVLDGDSAREGLEALAQRLAARQSGQIQAQLQALARAMAELDRAAAIIDADVVGSLSVAAEAAGDREQIAQVMRQRAGAAPRLAQDLRVIIERVREELASPIMPGVQVPAIDRARSAMTASVRDAAAQLGLLADEAVVIAQDRSYPEALRRAAIDLSAAARPARDLCVSAADTAQRLEALDVVRVLRSVGDVATAVLVGPQSAVALDTQTLLPPPGVLRPEAATAPSLRGRIEGLVASAMLTAIDPLRPIIVVAHAEDSRFIERPGALGVALGHLRRQGIDIIEWPLMLEADAPGLLRLDPTRGRPVIHLVLNTNTSVRSPDPLAPRPDERATKLGELVRRLVNAGEPLIVHLTPSEVVVGGGIDATAAPLTEFGLLARTGLALMHKPSQSDIVEHDVLVTGRGGPQPIQGAVSGLLTYMPWASPIEHAGEGLAWPLLTIDDEPTWAESRWSGYRRVPRDERPLVSNPPLREPASDDVDGPWTVAWAAERTVAGKPARVVVVGSNDWLADDIIRSGQSLDGRMVASYPGNLGLLDAAVLWLSGRDEFIAPTVSSSSVAMVRTIDPGTLSAMRWALVLGVPVLILAGGGAWRLIRR